MRSCSRFAMDAAVQAASRPACSAHLLSRMRSPSARSDCVSSVTGAAEDAKWSMLPPPPALAGAAGAAGGAGTAELESQSGPDEAPAALKSRSLPLNAPAVDAKWSMLPLAAAVAAAAGGAAEKPDPESQSGPDEAPVALKSRSLPLNEPAVDAKWSMLPLAAAAGAAGAAGAKAEPESQSGTDAAPMALKSR